MRAHDASLRRNGFCSDRWQAHLRLAQMAGQGYSGTCHIIDSKHFLPQRRKRAFMVFMHSSLSAASKRVELAFELVENMRVQVTSLDMFLDEEPRPAGKTARGRERFQGGVKKRWIQHTIDFIKKQQISARLLLLCQKLLAKSSCYSELTRRQQKLLACRLAALVHGRKSRDCTRIPSYCR